ncbi:DUF2989 domain-containing protein [Parasalinivibrio latis]
MSTSELCEKHPELCAGVNNNDSQCRHERTDLIWQRYDVLKEPTPLNKFDELMLLQKYQKCIDLSSQIITTKMKDRSRTRNEALLHSAKEIERLENELKQSSQPEVLFYFWGKGDQQAQQRFLELEGTRVMETSRLQLALATYYTHRDEKKALSLLHRALELFDGDEGKTRSKVIPDVIRSLATSYHRLDDTAHAYLWAKIAEQFKLGIAESRQLSLMYPMDAETRKKLDNLAEDVADDIDDGKYKAIRLNIQK